jgi:cation diffusion facilitator CzcD-associated flavoprotein CzcO
MAYRLKDDLGFKDFTIYEKLDGVGRYWRTNTYQGWWALIPGSIVPYMKY